MEKMKFKEWLFKETKSFLPKGAIIVLKNSYREWILSPTIYPPGTTIEILWHIHSDIRSYGQAFNRKPKTDRIHGFIDGTQKTDTFDLTPNDYVIKWMPKN